MSTVFDTTAPEQPGGGRGLMPFVLVLVVLVVAGAGIGIYLLTGGRGSGGANPTASGSPGASGPPGTPAPTPSGPNDWQPERLPTTGVRADAGTGQQPTLRGFAKDRDGAATAATAFLNVLFDAPTLAADRRAAVLTQIRAANMAPAERAALEAQFTSFAGANGLAANGAAPAGKQLVAHAYPGHGAYLVLSQDDAAARVVIWYYYERQVVSSGTKPTGAWRRSAIDLTWDGDWKLATNVQHQDGPTPAGAGRDNPPPPKERSRVLGNTDDSWRLYAG